MSFLPNFTSTGFLPPGDYELTFAELRESILVQGPDIGYPKWDKIWRAKLVDNLEILVLQLWQVGITEIFIDGSFVEDKDHPNDIDGYFVCDVNQWVTGEIQKKLNHLDPHQVWTWDSTKRKSHPDVSHRQLPMWHQYRVELYPHHCGTGLYGRHGKEMKFPELFRSTYSGRKQKGIIQIGGSL